MTGTTQPERPTVTALLDDLLAEQAGVRELLAGVGSDDWGRPTSPGWTVRDQVAHLAFFEARAATSVEHPALFAEERRRALADTDAYEREHLRALPDDGAAALTAWEVAADRFRRACVAADPSTRVQWFGPDMGLLSMVTARLMETWAHGQDVAQGLGIDRAPTARLRHVAALAVRARPQGYLVRGLTVPREDVRVELSGPGGESWTFGPSGAAQWVRGTAEDFCLALVRRRHVDDTALTWAGEQAGEWLHIGQAYAGPPGAGPSRAPAPAHGRRS